MLVGYSRPTITSWTIGGTGASIDTDDAALTDGRPGSVTRCTWLSGAQTTSSVVTLDAAWASADACKPRILALLGLTLPAGTLVKVQFPDGVGGWENPAGGNFSQRVQQLPDGSRCVWMVVDAPASDISSLRWEIYNDVDGVADIAADSEFDIGEAVLMPLLELPLETGWRVVLDDASVFNESLSHQVWPVERSARRVLVGDLARNELAKIAEGGLAGGMDLQTLAHALRAAKPSVSIPRHAQQVGGALDAGLLHRYAQFGYIPPGVGVIDHLRGPYFGGPWEHREVPAKAV